MRLIFNSRALALVIAALLLAWPVLAQTISPNPGGGGSGSSVSVTAGSSNIVINPSPGTGAFTVDTSTTPTFLGVTTTTLSAVNSALSGTTTFVGGISATGLSAGTVAASSYLGLNSSNQVVKSAAGAAFTPVLQPLSVTTTDTAGNEFPYTYFDSTTTGAAAIGAPSWGTAASLGADTVLRFRFKMPPTLPASGTLNFCSLCQANATSGVVKYTISDADIAVNNTASVGATALNAETQTSITWTNADDYVQTCTPLTESPIADHISAGAITFNHTSWTLAQILSCNFVEEWR